MLSGRVALIFIIVAENKKKRFKVKAKRGLDMIKTARYWFFRRMMLPIISALRMENWLQMKVINFITILMGV